jgi:hypothetical protein
METQVSVACKRLQPHSMPHLSTPHCAERVDGVKESYVSCGTRGQRRMTHSHCLVSMVSHVTSEQRIPDTFSDCYPFAVVMHVFFS